MKSAMGEVTTTEQYIVGIGASAGGLEAIIEFFENTPSDTGLSFVVIQHLSPDHKSLMAELLSRHTDMQVFEATEGVVPKPDTIYLIPSKKLIQLQNGVFRLQEKK